MSRSKHQSHRVRRKGKHPLIGRNRKHKPYGLHPTKYVYDVFKKLGWTPDIEEKAAMGDISNKAAARREGMKIIQQQLLES